LLRIAKVLKQAGFNSIRFSLPVVTPADWANLKGVERVGASYVCGGFPAVQMALDSGFSGDPGCCSLGLSFVCLEPPEILSSEQ
jgi:hypothetical protein